MNAHVGPWMWLDEGVHFQIDAIGGTRRTATTRSTVFGSSWPCLHGRCLHGRCFGFLVNRILQFIAYDDVARRRLNPQANAAPGEFHHRDRDVATDDQAFPNLACYNEHGCVRVGESVSPIPPMGAANDSTEKKRMQPAAPPFGFAVAPLPTSNDRPMGKRVKLTTGARPSCQFDSS